MHDDELWDLDEVCVYHGGLRPLDPSTVWKGIKAGRFSKPIYPTHRTHAGGAVIANAIALGKSLRETTTHRKRPPGCASGRKALG
jgi:hypothetical protein